MKNMILATRVVRFLFNPFRVILTWRSLRPLREIQLLFVGLSGKSGSARSTWVGLQYL